MTRRSHQTASSAPPPTQMPSIAATVTNGQLRQPLKELLARGGTWRRPRSWGHRSDASKLADVGPGNERARLARLDHQARQILPRLPARRDGRRAPAARTRDRMFAPLPGRSNVSRATSGSGNESVKGAAIEIHPRARNGQHPECYRLAAAAERTAAGQETNRRHRELQWKAPQGTLRGVRNMIDRRSLCGCALLLLGYSAATTSAAEPAADKTVRMTIDYGDGVRKEFTALPWKEGATVFDAMQSAVKHPRGIKVEHRGSGATTLITAIDGLKNEGAGRNWLYEVNEKLGETSCAVAELKRRRRGLVAIRCAKVESGERESAAAKLRQRNVQQGSHSVTRQTWTECLIFAGLVAAGAARESSSAICRTLPPSPPSPCSAAISSAHRQWPWPCPWWPCWPATP